MSNLKGATKFGLVLVSAVILILVGTFLVQYASSVERHAFVIGNVSQGAIFAISVAGVNSTSVESGATGVTFNISIKPTGISVVNITNVTFTLPAGFTFSSDYSNVSTNTSMGDVTNDVYFYNITSGGITNVSWSNKTSTGYLNPGLTPTIVNGSGQVYLAFRANVPGGLAKQKHGNQSLNITVTTTQLANPPLTAIVSDHTFLTIFINDTVAPANMRFVNPTRSNNTNTTNTTNDFEINFNETNIDIANITIGFGNNGTIVNRSMTVRAGGSSGRATYTTGFPDGKHNFTFVATDLDNVQTANTSTLFITNDATVPALTLTVPSTDVTKAKTLTSSDLTCSATDATSGFSSTSLVMTIEKPSGTTVNHNCGSDFTDTFEVGTYTAKFTSTDVAGNTDSSSKTFKVVYSIDKSKTSPSAPVAAPTVLATKTLTVTEALTTAKPVDLAVPIDVSSKAAVTKITVEVSKEVAAADASLEVKALEKVPEKDEKGQTLTALPSADQPLLKVIQLTPSANLSAAVKQATISFTLTKDELGTRTVADIVLARFTEGKWVELATTAGAAKADGSVDFTAVTPGFSVFAVAAEKAKPAATPTPTTITSPTSTVSPTNTL